MAPPLRLDLPTGHHLRPLREDLADRDYPAVMSSRERLWATYGEGWGWPRATLTFEQDRADLARHGAEFDAGEAFAYAVMNAGETALVGCVYIDPRRGGPEHDAVASWWVIDREADGPLDRTLGEVLPGWLRDAFGLKAIDRV